VRSKIKVRWIVQLVGERGGTPWTWCAPQFLCESRTIQSAPVPRCLCDFLARCTRVGFRLRSIRDAALAPKSAAALVTLTGRGSVRFLVAWTHHRVCNDRRGWVWEPAWRCFGILGLLDATGNATMTIEFQAKGTDNGSSRVRLHRVGELALRMLKSQTNWWHS
jgi:hypothetical protein